MRGRTVGKWLGTAVMALAFIWLVFWGLRSVEEAARQDHAASRDIVHVAGAQYDGIMVFHDQARHVTCWAMHNNGIFCMRDMDLEKQTDYERWRDGGMW